MIPGLRWQVFPGFLHESASKLPVENILVLQEIDGLRHVPFRQGEVDLKRRPIPVSHYGHHLDRVGPLHDQLRNVGFP